MSPGQPALFAPNSTSSRDGERRGWSPRRVLVLSNIFPSKALPIQGLFVKERVKFVSQLPGVDVRVVAPTPYFPPIRRFSRWYPYSQTPRSEVIDGLSVIRPRYFLPPKVGGYFHPRLMFRPVRRLLDSLRREFPFDLIDAHYVYPNGVLGLMLGACYRTPVVITCRGEDIACFPDLPIIGKRIRRALLNASQLVAVSEEMARRMESLGADRGKLHVIPNGVDCGTFRPLSRDDARRELGLPLDRPLVLGVGYRLELKGFHLLVEAIPKIRERHPNVLAVIVGAAPNWGADYTPAIEERIRALGLAGDVLLVGPKPHSELAKWYSAADVLSILSSREGSPNVLMEALACGLPAVGTPVGGVCDVLSDPRLGLLLTERTAAVAAEGLTSALSRSWDRVQIRRIMEGRSWQATALAVNEVFERALSVSDRSMNARIESI